MNEKNIVNAKVKDSSGKKLSLVIGEKAVTTPKLADEAVTPEKLNIQTVRKIQGMVDAKGDDLQNQIDSLSIHGTAVSNQFGTDEHISVSQKTITDAINKIWSKIEDITGESLQGINLVVNPEYFVSEEGCDIHISASTVETNGIFEHIAFYGNDVLIAEADNVDYFETDTEINDTTIIKCVAKILGIEYTVEKTITHYSSFWLGAGNSYEDVMNAEHLIPITNDMRGAYDVTVEQGNNLFVIVGDSLEQGFIRADMNGFEIPFVESSITVSGNAYKVFTSENTYNAGTYNIDING